MCWFLSWRRKPQPTSPESHEETHRGSTVSCVDEHRVLRMQLLNDATRKVERIEDRARRLMAEIEFAREVQLRETDR